MVSGIKLKSDYQQQGGVCLLASYAFLLEYAGVFSIPGPVSSVYDVFAEYMIFHNSLQPIKCYNAREIESEKSHLESLIGGLINTYCKTHDDIAGYQQIAAFHHHLVNNAKIPGIGIVDIQPPRGQDRGVPIKNAYYTLDGYLKQESYDSFFAALILYLTPQGAHTVFLGFDGDFFIRDSNFTHTTGNKASFGFSFDEHSLITEYMIFKLKNNSVQ